MDDDLAERYIECFHGENIFTGAFCHENSQHPARLGSHESTRVNDTRLAGSCSAHGTPVGRYNRDPAGIARGIENESEGHKRE